MTTYAHETAQEFSAFYRDCRVVGAAEEGGDEDVRIAICVLAKRGARPLARPARSGGAGVDVGARRRLAAGPTAFQVATKRRSMPPGSGAPTAPPRSSRPRRVPARRSRSRRCRRRRVGRLISANAPRRSATPSAAGSACSRFQVTPACLRCEELAPGERGGTATRPRWRRPFAGNSTRSGFRLPGRKRGLSACRGRAGCMSS